MIEFVKGVVTNTHTYFCSNKCSKLMLVVMCNLRWTHQVSTIMILICYQRVPQRKQKKYEKISYQKIWKEIRDCLRMLHMLARVTKFRKFLQWRYPSHLLRLLTYWKKVEFCDTVVILLDVQNNDHSEIKHWHLETLQFISIPQKTKWNLCSSPKKSPLYQQGWQRPLVYYQLLPNHPPIHPGQSVWAYS